MNGLEAKLRAIQELKREKYVGTQMAWKYLNYLANLEERPAQLAEDINNRIRQRLGEFGISDLTYEATPERIIGLNYAMKSLFISVSETFQGKDEDEGLKYLGILLESPLIDSNYFLGREKEKLEELSDCLTPIFLVTQLSPSDYFFGMNAVEICLETYSVSEEFNSRVLENAKRINWSYAFSNEKSSKIKNSIRRDLLKILSVDSRAGKMLRDQVDHRLEYRRELVADLIHQKDIKTYEEGLKILKRYYRISGALKEKLVLVDVEEDNRFTKTFERADLLLRCFASERRFVERFLAD